ncbi:transporter [Sphingomonas melonis]|uniref:Transporter n=1 Tax=Sphingomonas melonis TaxID=152682 RepID=A0A0D1KNH9_9SPHN|nr:transporter [Sphingomonas melonis]
MHRFRAAMAAAAAVLLAGCDLAPPYVRPLPPVPPTWPSGPAYPTTAEGGPNDAAVWNWYSVMTDPRLQTLVRRALADNRNLQAAVANVAAARAQYAVQRAGRLPTVAATAGASLRRGLATSAANSSSYSTDIGVSAFELDLFGRQKNLSRQAFERYLATDAGLASSRIALVSATATAYVTLAADRDLLRIAQDTLLSGQRSVRLTRSLYDAGLAPMVDVASAETTVAQARSDIEQDTTLIAQDRNALVLLVGGPVGDELLPRSLAELESGIAVIPAGMTSDVLLRRPDVLEAEHQLKAADAGIGAARAAFFPRITLTSAVGAASGALGALLTGGALAATVAPQATLPVLGGSTRGNLAYSKALRDYQLALYRYAIQSAFRDVADGLARRGTIGRQRNAQRDLVAAADRTYRAAEAQYRAGTDTALNALVAQRTLYASRQTEASAIQQDLLNRISLYEYVGGDGSLAGRGEAGE